MRVEKIALELAVEMLKGRYSGIGIPKAELFKELKSLSDFFERRLEKNLPKAEPHSSVVNFSDELADVKERAFHEGWQDARRRFQDLIQVMRTDAEQAKDSQGTFSSKAENDWVQKILGELNAKVNQMRPPEMTNGKPLAEKKTKKDRSIG